MNPRETNLLSVFLSRPTTVTPPQEEFSVRLTEVLKDGGFVARTVGFSDFGNKNPLAKVRDLMGQCRGAVVLGLAQTRVHSGLSKQATSQERLIRQALLPTPWNQLEAGMAYALNLPLLIVREEGVAGEGIFDPSVGDQFIHIASLDLGWLESENFRQPFEEWAAEVSR